MSRVISFRLDRLNPREAQALEILSAWQEQGFSVRHVLTEALLRLDEESTGTDNSDTMNELQAVLEQMQGLLVQLQNGNITVSSKPTEDPLRLRESFINSVKTVARSGLRLE